MTPADRTSVRGRSQAHGEHSPASRPSPSPEPRPGPCDECARLREQTHAASVTRDRARLAQLDAMREKHRAEAHGQRMRGAA